MTTPDVCQVPTAAAIPLHGKHAVGETAYALVDFTDAEEMLKYRWRAFKGSRAKIIYAVRDVARKHVWMHRALLGLAAPDNRTNDTDHINGNGLDNRRFNLRVCTRSQNQFNRHRASSYSGFKGVWWDKYAGVWRADIRTNGIVTSLGSFTIAEDAAAAYDKAAIELHGAFANTNDMARERSCLYVNPQRPDPRENKAFRDAYREAHRERSRKYGADFRAKHRDECNAASRKFYAAHAEQCKADARKRYARKKGGPVKTYQRRRSAE